MYKKHTNTNVCACVFTCVVARPAFGNTHSCLVSTMQLAEGECSPLAPEVWLSLLWSLFSTLSACNRVCPPVRPPCVMLTCVVASQAQAATPATWKR